MDAAASALAALFPDGDFRLHLTLRRGEPREFFAPPAGTAAVRAERAGWVQRDSARYVALDPAGAPLADEFSGMARAWGMNPGRTVEEWASAFDCDVLLLSRDEAGDFRLRGGALVFPTGWALAEKMGLTMDEIHRVVPGLNPALGAPIRQFLARLKPGLAYHRDNWGLAATDELNLHPARQIAPPDLPVRLEALWLRVEHQALVALPATGGIVFGIRIALYRLDRIAGTLAAQGLARALATMPAELAAYKRLDRVRDDVVRNLGAPPAK